MERLNLKILNIEEIFGKYCQSFNNVVKYTGYDGYTTLQDIMNTAYLILIENTFGIKIKVI